MQRYPAAFGDKHRQPFTSACGCVEDRKSAIVSERDQWFFRCLGRLLMTKAGRRLFSSRIVALTLPIARQADVSKQGSQVLAQRGEYVSLYFTNILYRQLPPRSKLCEFIRITLLTLRPDQDPGRVAIHRRLPPLLPRQCKRLFTRYLYY